MADLLTAGERVLELATVWEREAEVIGRRDPESPHVRVLRECASELRQVARDSRPQWVPHRAIQGRTGWGDDYLYQLYRALEDQGLARKRGRHWEVEYVAAARIPPKRRQVSRDLESVDTLQEMARVLAAG